MACAGTVGDSCRWKGRLPDSPLGTALCFSSTLAHEIILTPAKVRPSCNNEMARNLSTPAATAPPTSSSMTAASRQPQTSITSSTARKCVSESLPKQQKALQQRKFLNFSGHRNTKPSTVDWFFQFVCDGVCQILGGVGSSEHDSFIPVVLQNRLGREARPSLGNILDRLKVTIVKVHSRISLGR
jgi:hypothetical protein